ncbi:MAG: hypothetical protein VX938_02665, partial [Myxococcota bacterium]|nr:hypothetical protein [Myxococcota bacterium]
ACVLWGKGLSRGWRSSPPPLKKKLETVAGVLQTSDLFGAARLVAGGSCPPPPAAGAGWLTQMAAGE